MEKAKMIEESQKNGLSMRKNCEKWANMAPKPKKVPFLDGIRETLSLLRKERQTHCNLRKPIQVSSIRRKPLAQPSSTRVWGRNARALWRSARRSEAARGFL